MVYEKLSPYLDKETAGWLEKYINLPDIFYSI